MEERGTAEEISMKAFPQNLTANKVALKTIRFQPDSSQCMIALEIGEKRRKWSTTNIHALHFTIHALENPVEMDTNKTLKIAL